MFEDGEQTAIAGSRMGLRARARAVFPHGGSLPLEDWRRRHAGIMVLLWLNVPALPLFAVGIAGWTPLRAADNGAAIVVFAALGSWRGGSRKLRSISASLGLLTAAALYVDAAHGRIEAHFSFFVLIIVLTLYEDWTPFLVAVGFVLIHHGVVGMLDPKAVFDRPDEWAQPWLWAGIHAAFVAAAGIASLVAWRLNENVRANMRSAYRQLELLSETDSLTGLGNRRALMARLQSEFADGDHTVLILLDLDGFKLNNDQFGHPAGDALLVRLASHLLAASEGRGTAYRLGGDEFCAVWSLAGESPAALEAIASGAMSVHGEGFAISASSGSVELPCDANTIESALRIADYRMYASKHGSRTSTRSQTRDVLLRTLTERHPELGAHGDTVMALAEAVGRRLGLIDGAIEQLRHAAELHDIGKIAIPDAVLAKRGPLDDREWEFIHQHTIIGERILRAAPALAPVAEIVRSSHERFDGSGYPDGLAGEHIPLAARIIFVCDAFDAMTTERPYSRALPINAAISELRRCSGTQFDPQVVETFAGELALTPARMLENAA